MSIEYCDLESLDLRFTGIDYSVTGLSLNSLNNSNLFCIDINNQDLNSGNLSYNLDNWTSFSSNCAIRVLDVRFSTINYDPFTIDDSSCVYKMTYVPDDDFENLLESFGFGDGVNNDSVFTHHLKYYVYVIQTYNSVTTSLSNNTSTQTISNLTNLMISDLTGIEDFSNLEDLI